MIVKRMDQENVVVFLPKPSFQTDFTCKEKLETYFKQLFLKLEDRYQIELEGFFTIKVYQDSYYGVIFDIEKEDLPYLDYLEHQIDMSIQMIENSFILYQIDDILEIDPELLKQSDCYYYQNSYYIKLKKPPLKIKYLKLLEYSTLIFGNKTHNITKFGRIVDFRLCK